MSELPEGTDIAIELPDAVADMLPLVGFAAGRDLTERVPFEENEIGEPNTDTFEVPPSA